MSPERERFDDVVDEWLRYQASPQGRLRTELFWLGIQPHLPATVCDVLDVGGGSGELAELMARAGHRVILLDNAQPMLDAAQMRVLELICVLADVSNSANASPLAAASFDVIACHSVIEFVDDAAGSLARMRDWLRPGGMLSLAFGNQRHAALQAAIVHKNLTRARHDLHQPPATINRLGKPVRLLEPDRVAQQVRDAGFEMLAEYGVRCVTDLLDAAMVNEANFDALLELEAQMMAMPAYARIARFTHMILRRM
jgi:2-polyprenyl-3-methyl-5-hydroxy-6-metoxy-1,4-benzoquinol methylase